jgi:hypothetical protein
MEKLRNKMIWRKEHSYWGRDGDVKTWLTKSFCFY